MRLGFTPICSIKREGHEVHEVHMHSNTYKPSNCKTLHPQDYARQGAPLAPLARIFEIDSTSSLHMMQFHGKSVVLTGAGSGIGRVLVLELTRRGCLVTACCP